MPENMTIEQARVRYPALMAYIENRSAVEMWCSQLWQDQAEAERGGFADVAIEMRLAQADYGAYPYNLGMGRFLGLPIEANNEPPHGYYMAGKVARHHALGESRREAERLIAEGKTLRVVVARSKTTREPVRFQRFSGSDQIRIEGDTVTVNNGKAKGKLFSNWSVETCLQHLVTALRTGAAFGEPATERSAQKDLLAVG